MSIDASFSPAFYPALKNSAQDSAELRARTIGHAAGYAAGLREAGEEMTAQAARLQAETEAAIVAGQARVDRAVAVLKGAAEALERRTIPLITDAQDSIAATAIELAEAIIGRELRDDETAAASALHRALSSVDPAIIHAVRLNPDDLAFLDDSVIEATGVTFVADSSLARGDAVTVFAEGYLDARVSSALQRARAALLEEEL